jgi:hypothetical protein
MNQTNNFPSSRSIILIDVFTWLLSLILSYLLRFKFNIPASESQTFIFLIPGFILARFLSFYFAGFYTNNLHYTKARKNIQIILLQSLVSGLFAIITFLIHLNPRNHGKLPYSTILIEYLLSTSILVILNSNAERFYNFYNNSKLERIKIIEALKKTDITFDKLLILALVLTVAPLFIASIYNQPSADDFTFATLMKDEGGFWNTQKYWYITWGGRYFATAMGCLSPMVFHSIIGYKLQSDLLVAILVFAVYWVISLVFKDTNRLTRWSITSVIILLYFLYFPDIAQGLFWMEGAIVYQLPIVLTVVLLGCLTRFLQLGEKVFFIYCVLLVFALIGSNEVTMLYSDFLVSLLFIGTYVRNRKINYYLLALTVFAILFSLFVIAAPGNEHRGTYFPGQHQFLFSVQNAYAYGANSRSDWTWNNIYIFLVIFSWFLIKTSSGKISKPVIHPFFILLICIFIPFIGYFVGFWSMGTYPPSRTVNLIYFYFLLSSIYFLYSLAWYLTQGLKFNGARIPAGVYSVLVILMAYSVLGKSTTLGTVYDDISSGRAANFNKQIEQRLATVQSFKGHLCKVKPITDVPKTFNLTDISSDTTQWTNQLFAQYYGKMCVLEK